MQVFFAMQHTTLIFLFTQIKKLKSFNEKTYYIMYLPQTYFQKHSNKQKIYIYSKLTNIERFKLIPQKLATFHIFHQPMTSFVFK